VEGEVHIVTGAVTVAIGIMNRLCSYLRLLGDVVSQLSTSLMRAETAQACPPQKPPW
jgi:hypothetical protein